MRFLLSDGNATYEDGVFTFALDRRLRNATRARVRKVSYIVDPTLAVVPSVVYLRSRAFHSLAANKHTVILTATQHENSVDVLASLEEEHTTGRFRLMEAPRSIPLNYMHLRNLDFYFTNPAGDNLSFTETLEDAVTAAAIAARADLFLFLNYTDSTKVLLTGVEPDVLLTEIEAVNDATFEFIPNSGSGIAYEDFGSNGGKCAQFNNDWIRLNDASTAEEPEDATFCMLFQSQANSTDVQVLVDWYRFRIYVNSGGKLSWYDGAINETSISVENSTDYLISIRRDNSGLDPEGFAWRLEKLSDNSVQVDETYHGGNSPGTGLFDLGGNSSYSAAGFEASNLVVITSIADADVLVIETYLKQSYRGLVSASSGSASTDATFFIELDVDVS